MSGRFERFDARPGGSYRLVLTYDEGLRGSGKTTHNPEIVEARFATAAEWVDRLAAAHHDGRLQDEQRRLGRYPLLVIDEVG
jgi:hypothetical protein